MKKVASLKYGVVFKKAFCDPEIFTAFVNDILGLSVVIDKVETEKSFDPPIGYVKPRFDLFAEDKEHRIIIDIQHARHSDHYDRFLYYHCVALLEQIANSENYRPGMKVYTVVVLTSGDKHKTDIAITDFDPHNLKGESFNEIPHKIIHLCPKYINDSTPKIYREWMQAINDTLDKEVDETQYESIPILKMFDHILTNQISPEERARMIEEYHMDELEEDSFAKGEEVGIEKGIEKEKKEIAKAMLSKGMTITSISEITGLSKEEIEDA